MAYPPRPVTKQFNTGKLNAITFTEQTSNAIMNLLDVEENNIYLPGHSQQIVRAIAQHYLQVRSKSPVVICPDFSLPPLLRQFDRNGLALPLVMASEIPSHIQIDLCIEPIQLHELV